MSKYVNAAVAVLATFVLLISTSAIPALAKTRSHHRSTRAASPSKPKVKTKAQLDKEHQQTIDKLKASVHLSVDTTTGTEVFVGGIHIIRVWNSDGGFEAKDRASEIQARLNIILGLGPILPSDITTQMDTGDATVTVKGHLLFVADPATAAVNDTEPMALANEWAASMRQILPTLTAATGPNPPTATTK